MSCFELRRTYCVHRRVYSSACTLQILAILYCKRACKISCNVNVFGWLFWLLSQLYDQTIRLILPGAQPGFWRGGSPNLVPVPKGGPGVLFQVNIFWKNVL